MKRKQERQSQPAPRLRRRAPESAFEGRPFRQRLEQRKARRTQMWARAGMDHQMSKLAANGHGWQGHGQDHK
eukprot:4848153-Pleurochrysis_carterae.AAC.1